MRSADVPRLPGAASRLVASLLAGPPVPARVLAAFPTAVYVDVGGEVVALLTADAARLPIGVLLAATAPFGSVRAGQPASVGGCRIRLAGLDVEVVREWEPVPALAPTGRTALADALGVLTATLAGSARRPGLPPPVALQRALAADDHVATRAAAVALLGRGPGLTPSGDDMLAGALVAALLLPAALGAGPSRTAGVLADCVRGAAPTRTTTPSAALLRAAAAGAPSAEVARVLGALCAPGNVRLGPALDRLLAVGAHSGPDLAAGLLAGATAVVHRTREAECPAPWRSGAAVTPTR